MHRRTSPQGLLLLAFAALAGVTCAAEEPDKTTTSTSSTVTPCVATATNGAFFDLTRDTAVLIEEGEKPVRGHPTEDYVARGWDYGANFTLNICGSVIKKVKQVEGVEPILWKNISAYYESDGKIYSLGQESSLLVPRGRKLVLQYVGGSPCGAPSKKEKRDKVHEGANYRWQDYDDEDTTYSAGEARDDDAVEAGDKEQDRDAEKEDKDKDKDKEKEKEKEKTLRRKSATISFLCDRDLDNPTAASFVGTDPDECAYFFEVRSAHACAMAEPHKPGSVGPGSVFAIIFVITVLVYIVGGIFYQRTVAHARGWRQLPNYSLWAGIWSFLKDIAIILTSSCARFMPRRRGYRSLDGSPSRGRFGRGREDENRLIDQLDEEWDD